MASDRPGAHDVAAYLTRLGLDAEPPSVDGLARLHAAHVERVPYETLWIHLGERWTTDPLAALRRVAHQRRGGYCYQLNGAFALLLQSLGYRVTRHVGGVHHGSDPDPAAMSNHLVLVVHDLPDERSTDGRWYVDAGLGDALHHPLPLVSGEHEQGPFRLRLDPTDDGVGDWHLTHDPAGSFGGMSFLIEPADPEAFDDRHAFLSTSPESGFVRTMTAQCRHADRVDVLRGLTLSRLGVDTTWTGTLERRRDWLGALADVFGLVPDPTVHDIGALWARARDQHESWLSAEGARASA